MPGCQLGSGTSLGRVVKDEEMQWDRFTDHRRVQVVGHEFHQPPLKFISGGHAVGTTRYECTATLRREPDNAHDPRAIEVLVEGNRIGYLKRGSARRLNKRLRRVEEVGEETTCIALIRDADNGLLQAHLQIPYSSKLLEGWPNPKRQRR